jgi:hypothetical protein
MMNLISTIFTIGLIVVIAGCSFVFGYAIYYFKRFIDFFGFNNKRRNARNSFNSQRERNKRRNR